MIFISWLGYNKYILLTRINKSLEEESRLISIIYKLQDDFASSGSKTNIHYNYIRIMLPKSLLLQYYMTPIHHEILPMISTNEAYSIG